MTPPFHIRDHAQSSGLSTRPQGPLLERNIPEYRAQGRYLSIYLSFVIRSRSLTDIIPNARAARASDFQISSTRDRIRMRAFTMPFPVGHRRGVVGVGVAVVAEVRTGVVLADVLGHDAAAGEALAGVFQALHEPVGVERGDVRRTARGDDDRHLGQRLRAVLQLNLIFRPRCHDYTTCVI